MRSIQRQLWPVEEQRNEPDGPSVRTHSHLHDGCREKCEPRGAVRRNDCAHEKGQCEEWRNEDPQHGEVDPCREGRRRRMPTNREENCCRNPRDRHSETQYREHCPEMTVGSEEEERCTRGH